VKHGNDNVDWRPNFIEWRIIRHALSNAHRRMNERFLLFDCETVPDLAEGRRMPGMAGAPDGEVQIRCDKPSDPLQD